MTISSSDKGPGTYIIVRNGRGQRVSEYGPYPQLGTPGMEATFDHLQRTLPTTHKISWMRRGTS